MEPCRAPGCERDLDRKSQQQRRVGIDTGNGQGGSNVTIGGTLTNSGTVQIGSGNANLSAPATVTATDLANTGTINLIGNPTPGTTAQATLNITNGTAPATWTTTANLAGDALLEFAGGQITSIAGGAQLTLNGAQSRVADASDTSTSSALAHLASNAGTFALANGNGLADQATSTFSNSGSFSLSENTTFSTLPGVGFNNSGGFAIDTGNGQGGSNVTIGGTLTNSGGFQIGNSGIGNPLSAPTPVTAIDLVNTGTINLIGNPTNPANQASIIVNGQASNAGSVNIPINSSVTVTGAGNAYTQTAGSTNLSGGTLAAPNVNINGGTLQGLGTVTGALNIAGTGTIEAINLGNGILPAAITNDSNYSQSGGTFDAPLHGTGAQIDMVNVTSGHSVDLTGGDLEPFGVTFAAGQVFDDIMTFQPGELTGTFATILGGGNGTSVNLGNGLTLEAIYDNAGGEISLEVVKTVPVPAPPIGRGAPVLLAVGVVLLGIELRTRRKSAVCLKPLSHTQLHDTNADRRSTYADAIPNRPLATPTVSISPERA